MKKNRRYSNYNLSLNNEELEVVSSFKYLGVYFFKNGNWSRTEKCIAEHASKTLFSILNQYDFKTLQKWKLFETLVAFVLNYSAEVWGFNEAKNIHVELLHTKQFLWKILCVNKSTNITGLYGELWRVPLIFVRKVH